MQKILLTIILSIFGFLIFAQHPGLTLTKKGVQNIKDGLGQTPIFDNLFQNIVDDIDNDIVNGIDVPIPRDMAGGYTHEQHKRNYKSMLKAAKLYQFTDDEKYAKYVKEMLMEYAKIYPALPLHPTNRSYATGKIFWQCLNDANWLVYTSQTYDCIFTYLSKKERTYLEKNLFIPFANFLSEENPRFFNRIHNHSTWANAAVGMMALVMDNDTLLEKALYGLKKDYIDVTELDNDGGFIKKSGEKSGFLAQLDNAFTPDGYFTEGPYYQRYAIFPFMIFSQALENKRPDLHIFEYRDNILKKATFSMLQLTDSKGQFFPINDSQKGMTFRAFEVVNAVDLMYQIYPEEDELLDWAKQQDKVAFNEAGFLIAKELNKTKTNPIQKKSIFFGDGVNGDEGGIAVMRMEDFDLLFKFSTHGMGHGHYDRLSYSLYDEKGEILQDYGAVRWVNIEQKGGGRYLPENKTFGKQTIAHNTLTVNQKSQFNANIKEAEKSSPELVFHDFSAPNLKIVSAREDKSFKDVTQQRTLILYKDDSYSYPLAIDILQIEGESNSTYDLPFWFKGHFMSSSVDCPKEKDCIKSMGSEYGYQHIWQEASCDIENDNYYFNWFNNDRFYTISGVSSKGDQLIRGRAGASDSDYNLRPDPIYIHKKTNVDNALYLNILEAHGKYNRSTEIPNSPYRTIQNIEIIYNDSDYIIAKIENVNHEFTLHLCTSNADKNKNHRVSHSSKVYEWEGTHLITKNKI